jgi:hypothetical protein
VQCVGDYSNVKMLIIVTVATRIGDGCQFDEQCTARLVRAVCANAQCRCAAGTTELNETTCGKFHS